MIAPTVTLPANPTSTLSCPVLLGRGPNNVWVARVLGWAECSAEGATREDALKYLEQRLTAQLTEAEIVQLEISLPRRENPWLKLAGKYKDDAMFTEMMAEIERERRELDAEIWGQDEFGAELEAGTS
jgi:predicted RNase H-like HicB family nuclease